MTFLDGLGSIPQLSTFSREGLRHLKSEALSALQELAPLPCDGSPSFVPTYDPSTSIGLGSFAISKGPLDPLAQSLNFRVPTTLDNAIRVVRACQVNKPILLEGSPGVGKTSLISALANIAGHPLCRINLSDQTDIADLFGCDLPVEGGGPGEFAWKDADFLKAMQDGHWVLLDEMNLAPQAVLEGLNAVLDHRGTVYIPELGRSFSRHPAFRIFAAQNPLHQGGGRKGLPKSFLNRFTKVYVEELTPNDLLLVCEYRFPSYDASLLKRMITYNTSLSEAVSSKRHFGREGGPWEFNLRDVIRWGTLLTANGSTRCLHPGEYLGNVYISRFRTPVDRVAARTLYNSIFGNSEDHPDHTPRLTISSTHLQIGRSHIPRTNRSLSRRTPRVLQCQLVALETVSLCVSQSWLVIITGPRGSGKSSLIQALAGFTGNALHEISINSATDTMDILGSFEQVDTVSRTHDGAGRFEWVDGPLVTALKQGSWLLLDSANLCNPSVLDRLNSLCEPDGVLTLSERGFVHGEDQVIRPHPNFRLFMTMDPQYGELSRAMRNRGMEVSLIHDLTPNDRCRLWDHLRLPIDASVETCALTSLSVRFALICRGLQLSETNIDARFRLTGHTFSQDSSLSALLQCDPLFSAAATTPRLSYNLLDVLARVVSPTTLPLIRRSFSRDSNEAHACRIMSLIRCLDEERPLRNLSGSFAKSRQLPYSLVLVQVSPRVEGLSSSRTCTECLMNVANGFLFDLLALS
jgi:midasin (ATPase involved in ribosome maturation)